jgi:NTP pyrophosphatase (non-canonical NTP hydrolase)
MNFDTYQGKVAVMPLYDDPFLGLVGEVGEVIEHIKKARRPAPKTKPLNKDEFAYELGDVLWYLTRIINDYGYTLDAIAEMNIVKLNKRHNT